MTSPAGPSGAQGAPVPPQGERASTTCTFQGARSGGSRPTTRDIPHYDYAEEESSVEYQAAPRWASRIEEYNDEEAQATAAANLRALLARPVPGAQDQYHQQQAGHSSQLIPTTPKVGESETGGTPPPPAAFSTSLPPTLALKRAPSGMRADKDTPSEPSGSIDSKMSQADKAAQL